MFPMEKENVGRLFSPQTIGWEFLKNNRFQTARFSNRRYGMNESRCFSVSLTLGMYY